MPARRRTRGHIEELPSGSFRAIVYAGVDPLTGRAHRLKETAESYAEAQETLTRLQHQVDQQQHPKSAITVGEAVDQWLEVAKLEELTRDRYEDLIRIYIVPTLGKLQAGRLDAELLERFYARLERCRDLCSGRPPKGHTCRPLAAPPGRSTTSSAAPSAVPSAGSTSTSTPPNWRRHPRRGRRSRIPQPPRRPPAS